MRFLVLNALFLVCMLICSPGVSFAQQTKYLEPPVSMPALDGSSYDVVAPGTVPPEAGFDKCLLLSAEFDNSKNQYYELAIDSGGTKIKRENWMSYDRLSMWVYVDGEADYFDGRFRIYHLSLVQGPQTTDLALHLDRGEFRSWKKITFDLRQEFKTNARNHMLLYFYAYDKWLTGKGQFKFYIGGIEFSEYNHKYPWNGTGFTLSTYQKPLPYVAWIEGEDCKDYNWVQGPQKHNWCYYLLHGGACLDLSTWRLPGDGKPWYARFDFEVPDDGEYVVYFMGRMPGYYGSPIKWQIDKQLVHSSNDEETQLVSSEMQFKYALLRLGDFKASAGRHTITIMVDEVMKDAGLTGYSQIIDAIAISRKVLKGEVSLVKPLVKAPVPDKKDFPKKAEKAPAPKRPPIKILSGRLKVEIDGNNGGFKQIMLTGRPRRTLVDAMISPNIISVRFISGKTATLETFKEIPTNDPSVVILEGRSALFEARITYRKAPLDSQLVISAAITNRSREDIDQFTLAPVKGIGVGGNAGDDTYYVGGTVTASPEEAVGRKESTSPGFSHDWVCITDKAGTLYIYWKDKEGLDSKVTYGRRKGERFGGAITISKQPRINPGETWKTPECVIGGYSGDWHKAADYFRQWWYSWAVSPNIPKWLTSAGGTGIGGPNINYYEADNVAKSVQMVKESMDKIGFSWTHWMWLPHGTEAWYPNGYKVSMDQLRELRKVHDAIHTVGGYVSLYTNGLIISRLNREYELFGRDLTARASDGFPYLSEHNAHHHPMAVTCPWTDWPQRYLSFVKEAALSNADCLYIDQIGIGIANMCYSKEHQHKHPGTYTSGWSNFVRIVTEELHKHNPDLVTMVEWPNAMIQQYATLALLGNTDIMRYTFPTYHGVSGWFETSGLKGYGHIQQALLAGNLVHLITGTINAMEPAILVQAKELVLFKRKVDPLIWAAHYRHDVGLTVSKGLQASVLVKDGKQLLIPVVRDAGTSPDGGSVAVDPAVHGLAGIGKVRMIKAATPEKTEEWTFQRSGSQVSMAVPTGQACLFILEK